MDKEKIFKLEVTFDEYCTISSALHDKCHYLSHEGIKAETARVEQKLKDQVHAQYFNDAPASNS